MKPLNIQSGMQSVKIPDSALSVSVPEGCEILLSGVEDSWAEGWNECNVHLNLADGSILTGTASWEASGKGSHVVNPVAVKAEVERMLNTSEPSTPKITDRHNQ